jgi:hypothetical protein
MLAIQKDALVNLKSDLPTGVKILKHLAFLIIFFSHLLNFIYKSASSTHA